VNAGKHVSAKREISRCRQRQFTVQQIMLRGPLNTHVSVL